MLYNIYFSPTGGTKKVADILAGNLGGEVCEVDVCRDIKKNDFAIGGCLSGFGSIVCGTGSADRC